MFGYGLMRKGNIFWTIYEIVECQKLVNALCGAMFFSYFCIDGTEQGGLPAGEA